MGVQFKVRPEQSNWQNGSHRPVLEIRRSKIDDFMFNKTICSATCSMSGFALPWPDTFLIYLLFSFFSFARPL